MLRKGLLASSGKASLSLCLLGDGAEPPELSAPTPPPHALPFPCLPGPDVPLCPGLQGWLGEHHVQRTGCCRCGPAGACGLGPGAAGGEGCGVFGAQLPETGIGRTHGPAAAQPTPSSPGSSTVRLLLGSGRHCSLCFSESPCRARIALPAGLCAEGQGLVRVEPRAGGGRGGLQQQAGAGPRRVWGTERRGQEVVEGVSRAARSGGAPARARAGAGVSPEAGGSP